MKLIEKREEWNNANWKIKKNDKWNKKLKTMKKWKKTTWTIEKIWKKNEGEHEKENIWQSEKIKNVETMKK